MLLMDCSGNPLDACTFGDSDTQIVAEANFVISTTNAHQVGNQPVCHHGLRHLGAGRPAFRL